MLPLSVNFELESSACNQQAGGAKSLKRSFPFHSDDQDFAGSLNLKSEIPANVCTSPRHNPPYLQDDSAVFMQQSGNSRPEMQLGSKRDSNTGILKQPVDATAMHSANEGSFLKELEDEDRGLDQLGDGLDGKWAEGMLLECADAINKKDVSRIQHLLWMLNELASPYGDYDQRLASCFAQALYLKITGAGARCYRHLCAAAERNYSFDLMRQMLLKFQDASPWNTFGHVAANGAIMEAMDGEENVHIVDMSNTLCTQWPTLLEALANRPDGAPRLRLTVILSGSSSAPAVMNVMEEIGNRLKKFARLMGVPFELRMLQQAEVQKLQVEMLDLREGEALAINCIHTLHQVSSKANDQLSPRDFLLCTLRNMNPKIVTLVEEEIDLSSSDNFLQCFSESLRFYSLRFDSLEQSFPRTSNERLMLEKIAARNMVSLLACDEEESGNIQMQEKSDQWALRMNRLGFSPSKFSDEVVDDVRSLLKRYKEGWGNSNHENCLFLTWKDQRAVFASAWLPC